LSCPSCGSHHVVKCGRPLGRQRFLCRDCGKYFLADAIYHHHPKWEVEEALKMYSKNMSVRAISKDAGSMPRYCVHVGQTLR